MAYRSSSTTPATIFSDDGLSIDASCTNSGDTLVLVARTATDASIYSYLVDTETNNLVRSGDSEGGGFNPGSSYDLTSGADDGELDPSVITFVYDTPGGRVATGTLALDRFNNSADNCAVTGHVFMS